MRENITSMPTFVVIEKWKEKSSNNLAFHTSNSIIYTSKCWILWCVDSMKMMEQQQQQQQQQLQLHLHNGIDVTFILKLTQKRIKWNTELNHLWTETISFFFIHFTIWFVYFQLSLVCHIQSSENTFHSTYKLHETVNLTSRKCVYGTNFTHTVVL